MTERQKYKERSQNYGSLWNEYGDSRIPWPLMIAPLFILVVVIGLCVSVVTQ